MARFCPLFSGSSGNCTYIGSSQGGILIDAGVSARRIELALKEREIQPDSISAIFVTHEHSDHISGLRVLVKRFGYKVYASAGTLDAMVDGGVLNDNNIFEIIPEGGVEAADLLVSGFFTSHDSRESLGFRVETEDGRTITVATDTGCITDNVRAALQGCDLALIESNHDVQMLESGGYPYFLKQRILCDTGHLSNECCAAELPWMAENGVTRFILGHLSAQNNRPELAYNAALASLNRAGLKESRDFLLCVAPRTATMPVMIL